MDSAQDDYILQGAEETRLNFRSKILDQYYSIRAYFIQKEWDPVSILLGLLVGVFISLLFVGLLGFFKSSSIEDSPENFLSSLYYGCYTDTHNRLLNGPKNDFRADNTPIKCIKTCKDGGFTFAGVEYSYECFCGNELKDEATKYPKEKCDSYLCPGSLTEFCGGHWLMTVYRTTNLYDYISENDN